MCSSDLFADLGVLAAADADLESLMKADEDLAERIDEQKYAAELTARKSEVDAAIADAASV